MSEDSSALGSGLPDPFRLLIRDRSSSTNDDLRELAAAGAPDGQILLAREQTAGRGRRGASWHSGGGDSLAFSILARPTAPPALWPRLALAAGLSVAEAIEGFGTAAGIKWPNDVWIGRRKVAGILVEGGPGFAIIGIGLNVNNSGFPDEITDIATSMRQALGDRIAISEVLAAVIRRFARRGRQIDAEFDDLLAQIRRRCVLTGEHVTLRSASGMRQGTVEGIGDTGELLLRTEQGIQRVIQADEVRITNRPGT